MPPVHELCAHPKPVRVTQDIPRADLVPCVGWGHPTHPPSLILLSLGCCMAPCKAHPATKTPWTRNWIYGVTHLEGNGIYQGPVLRTCECKVPEPQNTENFRLHLKWEAEVKLSLCSQILILFKFTHI